MRTPRQRRAKKPIVFSSSDEDQELEANSPADNAEKENLLPKAKKQKVATPVKEKPKSRVHKKTKTTKIKNPVTISTQTTPGLAKRTRQNK